MFTYGKAIQAAVVNCMNYEDAEDMALCRLTEKSAEFGMAWFGPLGSKCQPYQYLYLYLFGVVEPIWKVSSPWKQRELSRPTHLNLSAIALCRWWPPSPHNHGSRMLGRSLASPLLAHDCETHFCFSTPDVITVAPNIGSLNVNSFSQNLNRAACSPSISIKKWVLHSTAEFENVTLTDDDRKTLEACRDALSAFSISNEEGGKILFAFGMIHSPYWGEERKNKVPKFEIISQKLEYLRSLSLSRDDLYKLLKKFPEVLGCNLEHELKTSVQVLENEWGIKGNSLRNLLLRNPRVLGYNVDCKGECMAQWRCWVRF